MTLVTTHNDPKRIRDYRKSQYLCSTRDGGGAIRSWVSNGQNATGAVAIDTIYATPIYLPDTTRVGHVIYEVTTGSAGNIRLNLYTDSNGYPSARIVSETEITTAGTAGFKRQAIGTVLPCGFYWVAAVFSSTPTMRLEAVANALSWLGFATGSGGVSTGVTVAFTYAALPATFTGGGTYVTANHPRAAALAGSLGGSP